jgi:hypothetical protein
MICSEFLSPPTDPIQPTAECPPPVSGRKQGFMSSQPVHPIAGKTLRHWTVDSGEFVGGSQRTAPAKPYSEEADRGQFHRLASKLAQIKFELARRAS